MQFTKMFIFGYAFLYLILSVLGIPLLYTLDTIPSNSNILLNILFFIPNVIIWIFNILTLSTEYFIVNVILWIFRAIATIEIVVWIRGS